MITIKEYAEAQGIRTQAVYQQIKRKKNKEFIEKHSEIINGITYLDDEAVEYLQNSRSNAPTVVLQTDDKQQIEHLKRTNEQLLIKITDLQDQLIHEKDEVKQLQDKQIGLLTDSTSKERELATIQVKYEELQNKCELLQSELDNEHKKGFWARLFNK